MRIKLKAKLISGTGNSVICVNDVESAEGYTRKFDEAKMQQIVSKIFEKSQRERKTKMTYKEARAILPLEHICDELARQKALEALDKQIPKKTICEVVEIKSEGKQGYIRYLKCPNCKRNIDEENTVDFCPNCGQAIDWSDEI